MNTLFQTQPQNTLRPLYPTAQRSTIPAQRPTKRTALSAQQLLDVELGLFLLSQLLPTAPPDALPNLLVDKGSSFLDRPTWTPKQLRLLNRGRTMLSHVQQCTIWNALLDAYVTIPERLQAYDISTDRSRFSEKTVGFFRNRIITLRQTVA
ncbi:pPIWI_RE_Z domain-containing protein [Spirosoma fluminis]